MKFVHLGDLHIGKSLNGYSLIEDQKYIFDQILKESKEFGPDAILISGDVYDRSVPSEEAIEVYENFISSLSKLAPVYIISGNHDSGIRLELFNNLLKNSNIYIVGTYDGTIKKEVLETEDETAHIYMLPYFNPSEVRSLKDTKAGSHEEALEVILDDLELDDSVINILMSHQFYLNHLSDHDSYLEGSERTLIGGLDEIHANLIKDFDFAALGHIHGARQVGSERISYCGSPLKYSINESKKYLNLVEVNKDNVNVIKKELIPIRDIEFVDGYYEDLINVKEINNNYTVINLLDKKVIPNAKSALLNKFPYLIQIKGNIEHSEINSTQSSENLISQSPIQLLENFFKTNNRELSSEELEYALNIFKSLEEDKL